MRHFSLLILLLLSLSCAVTYGQTAPSSAEAYVNCGVARDDKGDKDGAIADYTKAIEINPKYADAYANRGLVKLQQGKDAEAQQDLDAAIKLDSSFKSVVEAESAKIKQTRKPKQ